MGIGRRTERRKARHSGLKLEHSFLFHISARDAWVIVLSLLGLVAIAEFHAPPEFWFGPLYIIVIALAAWSLGAKVALGIGVTILGLKFAAGKFGIYPYGAELLLPNIGARVLALIVIVGFIGMARKSCEREWLAARTDPLTKTLNRQAFFEVVKGAQSSGGWAALIYADLDGLKRLNDKDGHDQGDRSIKIFAETVRKTIRKDDIFARLGGDEFVIFMKVRDEEAGHIVARRLHQAINMGDPEETSTGLKCSLGILLLPDGSKSVDAELRAADELMYQAKKTRSGVFVAIAHRDKDSLALSPAIPITGTERDSSIRKATRENAPESGPRAAA